MIYDTGRPGTRQRKSVRVRASGDKRTRQFFGSQASTRAAVLPSLPPTAAPAERVNDARLQLAARLPILIAAVSVMSVSPAKTSLFTQAAITHVGD